MTDYRLTTPIKENSIRNLKIGDNIYITGLLFTARDKAHQRIISYIEEGKEIPLSLDGAVIYHCGPILTKAKGRWVVKSAGPTTSTRMNAFTPILLSKYRVRIIIGKGGMNEEVTKAMQQFGTVYCHFTGGAGSLAAERIKKVDGVEWADLGMAEAVWKLKVENFGPLLVAIDCYGKNLYGNIKKMVAGHVKKIYRETGIT